MFQLVFGANLLQYFKEETVSGPYNLTYDQYDICYIYIYIAIHICADKLYLYIDIAIHTYILKCVVYLGKML